MFTQALIFKRDVTVRTLEAEVRDLKISLEEKTSKVRTLEIELDAVGLDRDLLRRDNDIGEIFMDSSCIGWGRC